MIMRQRICRSTPPADGAQLSPRALARIAVRWDGPQNAR